jgi:hypothetical protein
MNYGNDMSFAAQRPGAIGDLLNGRVAEFGAVNRKQNPHRLSVGPLIFTASRDLDGTLRV